MRRRVLEFLVCPKCQGDLDLNVSIESSSEIEEGLLDCVTCMKRYPIVRGTPRFVSGEQYATSFGHQWNKYARLQLDSQNGTTFSEQRFYSITEWNPAELKGRLILDAGCGSGRFSEVALQAGAEVVAVDLSTAVDACRTNLRRFSNLHIVQASLYELPFRSKQFDYAFSIGVIQHCPDPRKAVLCVIDKVLLGGKAGFWIYELSWKSLVGTVGFKYLLRPITKRLDTCSLERFTAKLEQICWPINRIARGKGRSGKIIMRLLPVSCAHLEGLALSLDDFREWVRLDTFDMYSPAYDKPQRFSNVARWLESAHCSVDARHPHGAISITCSRR
jgi:2-polyprenyl-3-methyl-5-hydroxy-6-metoxy-1,4-benzoquinol methylase